MVSWYVFTVHTKIATEWNVLPASINSIGTVWNLLAKVFYRLGKLVTYYVLARYQQYCIA